MKSGNKQDEMWINPFVKQFANLGFPVSIAGKQNTAADGY